MTQKEIDDIFQKYGQYATGKDYALIHAIKEALAQQCVCGEPDSPGTHRIDSPCLAPQRTWVGLTDDDCLEALKALDPETKRLPLLFSMYAANIQAKLKEKNA